MCLFFKVSEYKTLPVAVKLILTAFCCKTQTAASLSGFKNEMYFRIVAQRLVMTDTLDLSGNGFLVSYAAMSKFNIKSKPFGNNAFQDLKLYLTHKGNMYFLKLFVPYNVKLRVFLFKLFQL